MGEKHRARNWHKVQPMETWRLWFLHTTTLTNHFQESGHVHQCRKFYDTENAQSGILHHNSEQTYICCIFFWHYLCRNFYKIFSYCPNWKTLNNEFVLWLIFLRDTNLFISPFKKSWLHVEFFQFCVIIFLIRRVYFVAEPTIFPICGK